MNPLQEKQILKENFSLHYYTQGDPNNPLIIFLHPAFSDHTCFYRQMDVFAQDYQVISLDMLGHGKSQVRKGSATVDQTAALVAEIIEMERHQQAHLVGVSLGSLIAQHTANLYPQKVKTVSVVGGYSIFGDNSEVSKAQRSEMVKWMFMVIFSMDRFRRYVAKGTNYLPAEQEVFYRSAQHFTRRSMQVMPGMQKVLSKESKSLPQPLLIISGEHDLPVVLKNSLRWHQQETSSQYHTIPTAGHCANMDNAPEFNRILGEFLTGHAI